VAKKAEEKDRAVGAAAARAAKTPAKGAAVARQPMAGAASSGRPLKGLLSRRLREAQNRKTLLFISTGNTCRSPMAAAYFRKLLEDRKIKSIEVRSAGVMTIPGLLATDESKLMLEPYGISLERHRSQPLTEEMLRKPKSELLVLGMTPFHVQMALRCLDEARERMHLLKEFTNTDPKGRPIPDPMGCTLEVYKKVFRQIKQACDALIEHEFITGKAVKVPRLLKKGGAAPSRGKVRKPKPAVAALAKAAAVKPSAPQTADAKPAVAKTVDAKPAVAKTAAAKAAAVKIAAKKTGARPSSERKQSIQAAAAKKRSARK
jgi:protein-tyrosine-phosphatase